MELTGYASISAAAIDDDDALAALLARGLTALRPGARFERPPVGWTGTVAEQLELEMGAQPDGVAQRLALDWGARVGRRALARAGIGEPGRPSRASLGLVLASNLEDHPRTLDELAVALAEALELGGPRLAVSMACASSVAAFALARLALADCDAVLVVGSDVLTPRVAGGFGQLGLLADGPCEPMSARVGTSLGEGAAAFVLEPARGRPGARLGFELRGEALVADAFHATSPEPNGRGTRAAIEAALADAGHTSADLDLVAVHGTGTRANDDAERRGLDSLGLGATPRVALKRVFGHAQGAASAVELAGLAAAWSRGLAPVSVGSERPADALEAAPAGSEASAPQLAVVASAGFGGTSAALVFARSSGERADPRAGGRDRSRPPIYLGDWVEVGWSSPEDADIDWRRVVRGVDLRTADPATKMLILAVARALGRSRDPRTGLVVGMPRSSRASCARLRDEIERHGLEHVSASALTDPLLIMPAGACTRALDLRGPFGLCVAGGNAVPLAICWAADRWRSETPRMLAAGVDESETDHGAAAVVLAPRGQVELAGWSLAGPGRSESSLARACARAGYAPEQLAGHEHIVDVELEGGARAVRRMCEALAPGEVRAASFEEPERAVVTLIVARAAERDRDGDLERRSS